MLGMVCMVCISKDHAMPFIRTFALQCIAATVAWNLLYSH